MGPGFRVLRCSAIHRMDTLLRGTTGGKVAKADRTKLRTLTVRRSFEPSRVAPTCLVEAYERVVPVTRRVIRTDRCSELVPQAGIKQRKGRI